MSEGEARIRERNAETIEFDASPRGKCNFAIHSPITINRIGSFSPFFFPCNFVFLFLSSFFTWNGLNVDFRSNIISDIILNAIGIGIEIELAFGNR